MNDKIISAFDMITATEELKQNTKTYIARKTHRSSVVRRIIPAAAAVICAVAVVIGLNLFFTPTTHITIDINPSLDLGINRFNRVVTVEPLNSDGKALAETLDIKYSDYEEAMRRILDNTNVKELLSENEVMTVTVIETNTAQCDDILHGVRECADDHHSGVHCHTASYEDASSAREMGLSYERYSALLQLQAMNYSITPEQLNAMSMREIRELITSLSQSGGNSNGNNSPGGSSEADQPSDPNSSSIPDQPSGGHHGNEHGHGHGYEHE